MDSKAGSRQNQVGQNPDQPPGDLAVPADFESVK